MKLPTLAAGESSRPTKSKHVKEAHAAVEKEADVRLNVAIPESLHLAVKVKASKEKRTIKEVVMAFLEDYLKN